MRVSGWRRGIGRPELSVRAKATGGEPLHITNGLNNAEPIHRPRVKRVVSAERAGASRRVKGQRI